MPFGLSTNAARPAPGSWLSRLFAPNHPDAFTAGVFDNGRWRFRLSAIDRYRPEGVVSLQFGERALRLRPQEVVGLGPRDGYAIVSVVDVDSDAQLDVSVPLGEVENLGLEL